MPYTIIDHVGENAFELSISPFLGLHPICNVEQLRPYFPPFLDTLDMAEHLADRELNPDYIEYAIVDQIMDTKLTKSNSFHP
jgi:hypothetical protein